MFYRVLERDVIFTAWASKVFAKPTFTGLFYGAYLFSLIHQFEICRL